MNNGITVNELAEFVKKQIKKGNGNKYVLLSDDVEGNGCHPMYYEFTDAQDNYEELEDLLSRERDGHHTMDNCVVLG